MLTKLCKSIRCCIDKSKLITYFIKVLSILLADWILRNTHIQSMYRIKSIRPALLMIISAHSKLQLLIKIFKHFLTIINIGYEIFHLRNKYYLHSHISDVHKIHSFVWHLSLLYSLYPPNSLLLKLMVSYLIYTFQFIIIVVRFTRYFK
uniref:Transmembrane protein n=1 Tax=Heterorhabditis bacteriophora TaxID=37862 RepID=A0A1I7W9U5_HETBA